MSTAEALRIADFRNLDLVLVANASNPPVCKMMNYGKYRFDMIKKDKEAKKAKKTVETKEIQLSQTIDIGDINVRIKHATNFINNGNKVRVSIRMRGRELSHKEISVEVLENFFDKLKDICIQEKKPTLEDKTVFMVLAPITKK